MKYQDIKKIDIHAHATPFPECAPNIMPLDYPYLDAKTLLEVYDKLNIEKGILLPLTSPEEHCEQISTGSCKYLADQYPDRLGWFCNIGID